MAAIWNTACVFISSTFRDMHAERDQLVKVVFPALRERLEKYRVHLIDIDLRWGVPKEQADNDQALDVCLDQIDSCRPFFVGILGERYGWVVTHRLGLAQFAESSEQIVPVPFTANGLRMGSKYGWVRHHTGKSITELEIVYGVLQNPPMRRHAFFYFRDPDALLAVPEEIRRTVYCETEPELIAKLHDLKARIRRSGYPLLDGYPARWDANAYDRPSRSHGRLVGLEVFGERVRDQLWQAIQEEFQLPEQPPVVTAADPLAEEQDYHERFMESRLRVYVGREQINDALLAFADGNDLIPCLVTGPSGSGKSAALARFVQTFAQSQIANQESKILIISHFIGASPRSTNLRDMLRRFCQVFKARFGFAEDVPEEAAKLTVTFQEFVGKVPADTRVLLVIDALNQLDEADRAQELYWLPRELPPQVKVIVSCISDTLAPTGRGQGEGQAVLEAFRWRKHSPVQLAALSDAEQRLIIRQVPSLSAKTLDDDQVRLLLSNPATANPLFLLVALEELRGFGSYEQLNNRIAEFPKEGDTVTAIFTQVIERLEEEFDHETVHAVLTLLASARRGLSERELQELLAPSEFNRKSKIENQKSEDLFPVLRQLRPYLLSRAGLLDFYHRNLFKAVRERYLDTAEGQQAAHRILAEHFRCMSYQDGDRPFWRTDRPRGLSELPYHQAGAGHWDQLEQTLCDFGYIHAKCDAGMTFDLVADYHLALAVETQAAIEPLNEGWGFTLVNESMQSAFSKWPGRSRVEEFSRAFTSCASQIAQAGMRAFLQSAIAHADASPITQAAEAWIAAGYWNMPWLRRIGRPQQPPQDPCLMTIQGHAGAVWAVTIHPVTPIVVSGGGDRLVKVWDLETGELLQVMEGHQAGVKTVAFACEGRRVVSGSWDKTIKIWDLTTGVCLDTFSGHSDTVTSLAVHPTSLFVASGSCDGTVKLWDLEKRTCRFTIAAQGEGGEVTALAIHPTGRYLVSAIAGGAPMIWDLQEKRGTALVGHTAAVTAVAFHPVGQRIISSSLDHTIKIWEFGSGKCIDSIPYNYFGDVVTLAISEDQRSGRERFLSLQPSTFRFSKDRLEMGSPTPRLVTAGMGNLVVWDLETKVPPKSINTDQRTSWALAAHYDGLRVVSGGDDGTLKVWDLESPAFGTPNQRETGQVRYITLIPGGAHALSINLDGTLQIWEFQTGRRVVIQPGHLGASLSVALHPDGCHALSGGPKGVQAWNLQTGARLITLAEHTAVVSSVAFHPDGQHAISGSYDGTVKLWDLGAGKCLRTLAGHQDKVNAVAIHRDGLRAISAGSDGSIRVWSLDTGSCVQVLQGHLDSVNAVEIHPDGKRLVSASSDKTLKAWDLNDGSCLRTLAGHRSFVVALAIHPAGCRLVSGSWDRTLQIWDLETGASLGRWDADVSITACAFFPDGRIATGDDAGRVTFLDFIEQ